MNEIADQPLDTSTITELFGTVLEIENTAPVPYTDATRARLSLYYDEIVNRYRKMNVDFGLGYHPDNPSDGYISYPNGYSPEIVEDTTEAMWHVCDERDLDIYGVGLDALRDAGLID